MYLTTTEAADLLKIKKSTVLHKIRIGLIPAQRLGTFGAWRVDEAELRKAMNGLVRVERDMDMFDAYGPKSLTEEMQYDELDRRCVKMATILGREPILTLLKDAGAESLGSLHPKHYGTFRARLMRLARGLTPKKVA